MKQKAVINEFHDCAAHTRFMLALCSVEDAATAAPVHDPSAVTFPRANANTVEIGDDSRVCISNRPENSN